MGIPEGSAEKGKKVRDSYSGKALIIVYFVIISSYL